MSIYSRLNFDFQPANSEILLLSETSKDHLKSMPKMLNDWQIEDIGNDNVGGYFINPIANSANSLLANVTNIFEAANTCFWCEYDGEGNVILDYASSLRPIANNFIKEIQLFKRHTDNISGVTSIDTGGDAASEFPYYDTATGIGRFLIYLTYESDGVLNNSPMVGSITSLFIEDEVKSNALIISTDWANLTVDRNTNPTLQVNTIIQHINTANSLISVRRNHDILFFRKSKDIVNDYNAVNKFSNMGETKSRLANEYIGTDKLKQRLANN